MQQAMAALASGQHGELLQQVSAKMGLPPDQLRQTAAAIAAGSDEAIPSEVVQRAMQLQWAMRSGAVPPMGPAAALAVPAGVAPGLLGAGGAGSASSALQAPGGGGAAPAGDEETALLLIAEEEERDGCLEL
jgi:hypothetical protein